MKGFLFDENLPSKIQFTPSVPIIHVSILGNSPSDTQIWEYAKETGLVIGAFRHYVWQSEGFHLSDDCTWIDKYDSSGTHWVVCQNILAVQ